MRITFQEYFCFFFLHLDALTHVFLLLKLEYVAVEELVQLLVAVVDAELLERVALEDLEAEDIQHLDLERLGHVGRVYGCVCGCGCGYG